MHNQKNVYYYFCHVFILAESELHVSDRCSASENSDNLENPDKIITPYDNVSKHRKPGVFGWKRAVWVYG